MKCPYTCNIEQANQWHYELDDSGNTVNTDHKMIETRNYIECLRSDCGAWRDGACHYNE